MASLKKYYKESKDELLNKVSWPTFSQLQSSSVIVLVATFIIAGIIYLIDFIFQNFMNFLYQIFS